MFYSPSFTQTSLSSLSSFSLVLVLNSCPQPFPLSSFLFLYRCLRPHSLSFGFLSLYFFLSFFSLFAIFHFRFSFSITFRLFSAFIYVFSPCFLCLRLCQQLCLPVPVCLPSLPLFGVPIKFFYILVLFSFSLFGASSINILSFSSHSFAYLDSPFPALVSFSQISSFSCFLVSQFVFPFSLPTGLVSFSFPRRCFYRQSLPLAFLPFAIRHYSHPCH